MATIENTTNLSSLEVVDDNDIISQRLREKLLKYESRDLDFRFTPNPLTGDVSVRKGKNSINQSIRFLLLTSFTEKLFRPGVGSGIDGILFEQMDFITERRVEDLINQVLENFEPRISVIKTSVSSNEIDQTLDVTIVYEIKNENKEVTFNTILDKIRG